MIAIAMSGPDMAEMITRAAISLVGFVVSGLLFLYLRRSRLPKYRVLLLMNPYPKRVAGRYKLQRRGTFWGWTDRQHWLTGTCIPVTTYFDSEEEAWAALENLEPPVWKDVGKRL